MFQFDAKKMGTNDLSNVFRNRLIQQLEKEIGIPLNRMLVSSLKLLHHYNNSMKEIINKHRSYLTESELMEAHQKQQNDIFTQVRVD